MDRTNQGAIATVGRTVTLEMTPDQLSLVEAGLKLLLAVEDDHEAIRQLKDLLAQVRVLASAGR